MIVLVVLSLHSVNKSCVVDCKPYVWFCKLISKNIVYVASLLHAPPETLRVSTEFPLQEIGGNYGILDILFGMNR